MLIGYMRVNKKDGSEVTDPQRAGLLAAGIHPADLFKDISSGTRDYRPSLSKCLKALHCGDTLIVWNLDQLGRDVGHLVKTVHDLALRGIGFKVLTGPGAGIDTTAPNSQVIVNIFTALAKFEKDCTRTAAARTRNRPGGRPHKMTVAKLQLAIVAMRKRETKIAALCREIGVSRETLYRHVAPNGVLRPDGMRLLNNAAQPSYRAVIPSVTSVEHVARDNSGHGISSLV